MILAALIREVADLLEEAARMPLAIHAIEKKVDTMSQQIDALRDAIKNDITDAIASNKAQLDQALAAAATAEQARDAVQKAYDDLTAEVAQLTSDVQAPGVYGQDQPAPADQPAPQTDPVAPAPEQPQPVETPGGTTPAVVDPAPEQPAA